jgi:hypothetical protein
MEFARQQSKKLLEEFIESLQPYTDAFIKSDGKLVLRNGRKIKWQFQKDETRKLEQNLNRHLEALRIYTDALFQYTAGWQFRDILSNITELRKEVAHISSSTQAVSVANDIAPRMGSVGDGYQDQSIALSQQRNEAGVRGQKHILERRELDIQELPLLHRAAARGSLRGIVSLIHNGQDVDEPLVVDGWLPNEP